MRFTQPQDLALTRTRINDLLSELADRNSEALERQGIRVRFQPDARVPDIEADGKRLYQAFVNLLAVHLAHLDEDSTEGSSFVVS